MPSMQDANALLAEAVAAKNGYDWMRLDAEVAERAWAFVPMTSFLGLQMTNNVPLNVDRADQMYYSVDGKQE